MSLHRQSPPASLVIEPDALAEHLRLPHAAPETDQTVELIALVRAATAAIERRLDTALIAQDWLWRTRAPDACLPLAPVISVNDIHVVARDGSRTPWTGWTLDRSVPCPRLVVDARPRLNDGSHVEVLLTAGYGASAGDVPDDLRHAVMLLAAHFYENREATAESRAPLPLGVAALVAPYRAIRLL